MINDLVYFDNSIVGRYRTVERNIKSKSNSFYDSFLDLLENRYITKVQEDDHSEIVYKLTNAGKQTLELTKDMIPGIINLKIPGIFPLFWKFK